MQVCVCVCVCVCVWVGVCVCARVCVCVCVCVAERATLSVSNTSKLRGPCIPQTPAQRQAQRLPKPHSAAHPPRVLPTRRQVNQCPCHHRQRRHLPLAAPLQQQPWPALLQPRQPRQPHQKQPVQQKAAARQTLRSAVEAPPQRARQTHSLAAGVPPSRSKTRPSTRPRASTTTTHRPLGRRLLCELLALSWLHSTRSLAHSLINPSSGRAPPFPLK